MQSTHVAFGDESNWKTGRYRAIGLISANRKHAVEIHRTLADIMEPREIAEFKWSKLKTWKYFDAARLMADLLVREAAENRARVDVLIWDTHDERHAVSGRDDIANLQRMYYHLFRNVLSKRWSNVGTWKIVPDQHSDMDWSTVQDILGRIARKHDAPDLDIPYPGEMKSFRERLKQAFNIDEISEGDSKTMKITQAADLFAGMGCHARADYRRFVQWEEQESGEQSLFDEDDIHFSNGDKFKNRLLRHFVDRLQEYSFGTTFSESRGLRTPNPKERINFWWYEPQIIHDQAPTRQGGQLGLM